MAARRDASLPPSNLQSALGRDPRAEDRTEEPPPCPKPSSSPPVAPRSGGPTRARSSSAGPTTWPPWSSASRARQGAPARPRRRSRTSSWAAGQPAGEAGYNLGRVAAILAGLPDVPGVTVNRYCSSSLQTIRMAAHAIRAGEGDVFVAAGVETVSRYLHGAADTGPHNPSFRRGRGAHHGPHPGGRRALDAAGRACPTSTSPWARRPRTWPSSRR